MDAVMESTLNAGHNNIHGNKIMPGQSSPMSHSLLSTTFERS